jgi:hypothetical protein
VIYAKIRCVSAGVPFEMRLPPVQKETMNIGNPLKCLSCDTASSAFPLGAEKERPFSRKADEQWGAMQ